MEAEIKRVEIKDPYDVWLRKPKFLTFNETDLIIVKAETDEGEEISETFYTSLKSDKTFSLNPPSRRSKMRRERLANFIKKYINPENPTKVEPEKWEGKKVKVKNDKIVVG